MLPNLRSFLIGLVLSLASVTLSIAAEGDMKFEVKGKNPGGKTGYTGEVTLSKLSPETATVRWITGPNKEVNDGFAIRTKSAIGAAYGGKALYAFAVYEIKEDGIHALWTTAASPKDSASYVLKGSDFEGSMGFVGGAQGSVTFTPRKGGLYSVTWSLPDGKYQGVGVRMGDTLVAASGDPSADFGVAVYKPVGDNIEGMWGTFQMTSPGEEVWNLGKSTASASGPAAGDERSVTFGGESYVLMENKSAPGQPTSELREYLRAGEDWAGYRKMVALRLQNVKGASAARMARATLEQVQSQHPGSYVREVEMEEDAATIIFILVTGADVEFNFWRYLKGQKGVVSAQFVLRNKVPYDTQKKFKAEQDKNYDQWLADLKALSSQGETLLLASAGVAPGIPPTAPQKGGDEEISPELVKAIKADLEKCSGIAEQFVGLIRAGKTEEAVGLMSDLTFEKVTREDFTRMLEKSNQVFGPLKSIKPDRKGTKFGVQEGVMTFTLEADVTYEKAEVRETYKFVRNAQGAVEFTGYNRTVKE